MKIGILVPMAEEIGLYQHELTSVSREMIGGAEFTVGQYRNHEVELVLAQSGIGKAQAAMTTTILFDHFDVDLIINSGSAGGVGSGMQVGELVLGDRVVNHDVDVTNGGNYAIGQVPAHELYFHSDSQVLAAVQATAEQLDLVVSTGLIATGDQFIADPVLVETIKHNFNGVQAVEMEGAAVAQIATNFNKPFLIIRAISDNGDDDASVSFDEFVVQAGRNAAKLMLAAIPKLTQLISK